MVDRPNPYSLQPNFIPTVSPQQLPPHLQQSQMQLPDKANTDFMRTMSMLHRERTGTDMQPAQFKHLAQMFRNQTAGARQPMVGQHRFGMAAPGQPSPFHEQQQAQPQISNFPNAGMQNSQLAYHNRMFQQPFPHQMRPDVMTQPQGQLIQNGNMPPQLTQQSASMVHPGSAGMFAPSDASHHTHVAPAHGALVTSQMPQNVQAPLAPQRLNYLDLKERIQQEELTISTMRQTAFHLAQNSNGIPEAESMRKAEQLWVEVNNRTTQLNRLLYLAQHQAQGNTVSNLLGGPSTRQPTPTQTAQNSTGWMSQPVPQASQGIATPQMPPGAPSQPSMQANLSTLQPPQNPLVNPSTPPRSGLPSHQPFGTQASPPMANNSPFSLSGGQPPAPNLSTPYQVPSLSKEIFHARYDNWCNSRNIARDQRLMSIDGRPIDLHALHVLVMRAGGSQKARNLWPIIGGHMGFVQFPSHDHQPARSSPVVAQHLAAVYEKYLANFDSAYIHAFLEMKQKAQAAQPQSTAMNGAGNANRAVLTSRQLQQLIPFANLSPAELRASKLPESAIRFVEAYRTRLQQFAQNPGAFSRNPGGVIGVQPQQAPAPVQFPNAHHSQIPLPSNVGPRPTSQVPVQRFAPGEPERNGTLLAPPSNANVQSQTRITRQQAESTIRRLREEALAQVPVSPHLLPEEQKADLIEVVEQLNAYVMKLEPKLATWYAIVKSEDRLKTILQWFSKIQQQRSLLQAGQSRFVQSLHQFRAMIPQMVSLENAMRTINVPITPKSSGNPLMTSPASSSRLSDTPAPQLPPVSRQPSNTHPAPKKKQPVSQGASSSATSSPLLPSSSSPLAATSSSTPASAATPTHTGPSFPSSPNNKQKAKSPAKRKPSKTIVPATELAQSPVPAPQPPQIQAGEKHAREDDLPPSHTNIDSSPKRIKSDDWDGPESRALTKKREEIENIKTEEDASAFYNNLANLVQQASGGEETLALNISDALSLLLSGCASVPDLPESSSMTSLGSVAAHCEPSSQTQIPSGDDFGQFLDFSFCGNQDDEDAAATPELAFTSSTNPSPLSASDVDAAVTQTTTIADSAEIAEPKNEHLDPLESLRLGVFKEIDGGVSAYYQPHSWKWDVPMPVLEQPWPIFTS